VAFKPNAEQQIAIDCLGRPLVITAGAGSGKTWVLARRFVNGIDPAGSVVGWEPADLSGILAITYTERAAGELAERVRRACAQEGLVDQARRVDEAWISTIHGFCSRFLRRHALEAGLDPGFRIARDVEAGALRDRVSADSLRAAVADDPDVALLVRNYGWVSVADAVQEAYDRARAMGESAGTLRTPLREADPGEADRLIADVLAVYERAVGEFATCGAGAHKDRCRRDAANGVELLTDLQKLGELPAEERLAMLRRVPIECCFHGSGPKETVAELRGELAVFRDRATEILAARAATALISATRRFEEAFSAEKTQLGVLDFEDLQLFARDALKGVPGLAERYRRDFRLVMIDEFQDTNRLQTDIVRMISTDDLCTVGDEHQSIYGFRYADVDVFRAYVADMTERGAESVSLVSNYRSHADIIDFVNVVFASHELFGEGLGHLGHERTESGEGVMDWPGGPRVSVLLVDEKSMPEGEAEVAEAEAVAEKVARLVASGVAQSDIAVLMRTLNKMAPFEAAMRRRGLRVAVAGGGDFFADPAVAAVRLLVRAIANVADDQAVAGLLAGPMVGLSPDGLFRVRQRARLEESRAPLWSGLAGAHLEHDDRERVLSVVTALKSARDALGLDPLSTVILGAVERLGHDARMLGQGLEGEHAYANTLKMARLADAFEATGGAGVAEFVTWLDTKERLGDREAPASVADETTQAVRFLTIHSAKGLEFPVVVMPALGGRGGGHAERAFAVAKTPEGPVVLAALPTSEPGGATERRPPAFRDAVAAKNATEADELRRLFYVGCTRAREALILSGRTDLAGDAEGESMVMWLRRTLGLGAPQKAGTLAVEAASASVDVTMLAGDSSRPWEAAPTVVADVKSEAGVGSDTQDASAAACPAGTVFATALGADEDVSYTRLERFEYCGRRFMLEDMARVGAVPEEGSRALCFGDAVHSALRLARGDRAPGTERIEAIAKGLGLDADATVRLGVAVESLLASRAVARAVALGDIRREAPFAVTLRDPGGDDGDDRPPILLGSIDLLARGAGGDALVIDYKTGLGGAKRTDAELRERYGLQADCYALAVLQAGAPSLDVTFVLPEVAGPDGAPREVTRLYDAAGLPGLRADIGSRIAALRAGPYERRAAYDVGCEHCAAYGGPLCDVRGPARRPGAASA
jgi:ATP-dependent exoDNAse (exonuclease V) beta subunit